MRLEQLTIAAAAAIVGALLGLFGGMAIGFNFSGIMFAAVLGAVAGTVVAFKVTKPAVPSDGEPWKGLFTHFLKGVVERHYADGDAKKTELVDALNSGSVNKGHIEDVLARLVGLTNAAGRTAQLEAAQTGAIAENDRLRKALADAVKKAGEDIDAYRALLDAANARGAMFAKALADLMVKDTVKVSDLITAMTALTADSPEVRQSLVDLGRKAEAVEAANAGLQAQVTTLQGQVTTLTRERDAANTAKAAAEAARDEARRQASENRPRREERDRDDRPRGDRRDRPATPPPPAAPPAPAPATP